MKDYLRQQLEAVSDNNYGRCLVREYLQARLLQCLQDGGAFASWVFVGGTALRFLYAMPRFSEDLDFSTVEPGVPDRFAELIKRAESVFGAEAYAVAVKAKTEKTVKSAFVKFEGLLFELGLSPHRSEIISIKVEIDTNPPAGAILETSVVRRHCLLNLQHPDKSSLLAGKLHAVLTRPYVKGRDVYDLLWYLSDRTWPEPNVAFLNSALKQTGWPGTEITADNWRNQVAARIQTYDFKRVVADVQPFLEREQDLQLLNKNTLMQLLQISV